MAVHQEIYHDYHITIALDPDPQNPREWDNLGTIAGWHRHYQLGDEQPNEEPGVWLDDKLKDSIILPIYMMDHSGLWLATMPFPILGIVAR